MKKNTLITLLAFMFFAAFATAFLYVGRESEGVIAISKNIPRQQQSASLPALLYIPKLDINVAVNHVGVTEEGDMATPEDPKEVAWYQFGTIPGNKGNAVIAGHLDSSKGEELVFSHLDELIVGDDIYLIDENDKPAHFKVIDMQIYPYDATNTEAVFGPADKSKLNLITCEGEWIQAVKSYSERLVVFTELQS